jgi:hypothetical protein
MTTSNWATLWLVISLIATVLTVVSAGVAWIHKKWGQDNRLTHRLPGWLRDVDLFTVLSGLVATAAIIGSAHCTSVAEASLENRLKPRTVTETQRATLVERLKSSPKKGMIHLQASILDAEATRYARRIEDILTNAGFEIDYPRGSSAQASLVVGPPGIHLVVKDERDYPRWVAYVQHCFISSGIDLQGLVAADPSSESNRVVIAVGQR